MKRLLPALAILAPLILPQAGRAQFYDETQLAKVEKIIVNVIDNMQDGCLPTPNVLKVEAELVLRRSGITVTDDNDGDAQWLTISLNGFQLKDVDTCTGQNTVNVTHRAWLNDGTSALVLSAQAMQILIWDKADYQDQLRKSVNTHVTGLANAILKARANQ